MAIAKNILLKQAGNNANFANNYKKLSTTKAVSLIDGTNWFALDLDIQGFTLGYIYFVTKASVDLKFEIYRSVGYQGFDTNYAVPIPGAKSTLPSNLPSVACADFNISLYGGDRIWVKVDAVGIAPADIGLEEIWFMAKNQ